MKGSTSGIGSRYTPLDRWAMLPHPLTFGGDATSVAVDADDRVFVLARGKTPVFIFEPDGTFVDCWGTGEFGRPHRIALDPSGAVWIVDDGAHIVQKRSVEGTVLLTLGEFGRSSDWHSGSPFNRPTGVAVHPTSGEVYVSDGYGNAKVHRFSPGGELVGGWGESGSGPGEFALPHDLIFLDEDTLLVTDRENYRLQFFDAEGTHKGEWRVHHPLTVAPGVPGEGLLYIGELGPPPIIKNAPSLGHKVTIYDLEGEVVGHLGDPLPGHEPTQFIAPHGIAVDSAGSVYVADVAASFISYSWREEIPRGEVRNLHKWTRSV